jgi:hypothetical protein
LYAAGCGEGGSGVNEEGFIFWKVGLLWAMMGAMFEFARRRFLWFRVGNYLKQIRRII